MEGKLSNMEFVQRAEMGRDLRDSIVNYLVIGGALSQDKDRYINKRGHRLMENMAIRLTRSNNWSRWNFLFDVGNGVGGDEDRRHQLIIAFIRLEPKTPKKGDGII